ncbi:hypothetical protein N7517_004034 [Penicillium concentricum]|uniref:Uncharacterized protein n=1 Tax=Penicillium concentricum TaxID=293559 RepID=A0A9W9S9F4_9EURO|nr:uncharacterized protein N7517_004034 [Penicillium concentricum]KAJ5372028.1 hypothetical protein N7517_004034 [Penicillium concentricum]
MPGERFLRAGWRAAKESLSVLASFPPAPDTERLGGLAGDDGAGAVLTLMMRMVAVVVVTAARVWEWLRLRSTL